MENHSVNTKQKTKKTVILLVAFFLICAAGLGGLYAWKNVVNQSVEEKDENDNSNTNDKTATPVALDENGMPEDGSDITETKQATDVDTLRKLLLEDGRFAIELTENVRIDKELVVKGTKKLVGNKSITMELYANAYQSVLTVPTGANLILDGVILDANGIANGVTVEKNAGFTGISGKILYGVPYGVLVEGSARIKDIVIDHSMDIGVCVMEGGKTSIEGGHITNSAQTAVHIQNTAQANISNDTIIDGGFYLVRNRGTCVITGGTLCNASGYLVYGTGDVTIDYKGKDADDKMEWYGADGEAGIRIGAGAKASISGLYLHDVAGRGIRSVNDTGLNVTNCVIENTGSYGIDCVNGKKPSYIEDVELRNTAASAVRVHGTVSVNVKDVTVKGTEGFGIKNENTLVSAENITFENCKQDGVWGNEGSTTVVNGAVITSPGRFAVSNNSAKMTLKNVMITDPGRMGYVGKVDSTVDMTDITITGAKERAIYNLGGQVTAKNVTIENAGIFAVSTAKSQKKVGSVTIKNLTVTGVKEKDALNAYESVLTVTDAKIADVNRYGALASKGGKMTLTNVELKNCTKRGVMGSGGIITLKDVVVTEAGEFGVTTAKSGELVGSLHADNLTITGVKTKNALNNNGSVMTVTGGKVADVGGNGIYVENGGQITISKVDITDCAKRGVYLTTAGTKAVLADTNISETVNSGIFQETGTVVEANQVNVQDAESYGIFLKGANFTGKNVTVANTKDNGINIDTSEAGEKSVVSVEGLTVKDTEKRAVANVGGDVTLSEVVITNPGTLGATTSKKGELVGKLVINGLKMTGVQDGNALNCNGSVLQVSDGKISDVTGNGVYVENNGQIALTELRIADVIGRGISLKESGAKAILKSITFEKTKQTAVYQEAGTVVEGNTLKIKNSGGYGVFMKGARFDVTDVIVHDTTQNPFNIDEASTAVIRGAKSTITKNEDTPKNVAIKVIASTLEIYDGTYNGFTNENGSVIYNSNSNVTIHGGTFKDNVATSRGAVLYATGGKAKVTIAGGTFQANTAERGGAVYIDKAGSLTITGGTFGAGADVTDAEVAKALGNVASYRGGVLYIADERTSTETVSISNAHFGYNKAFNNKGISSGVMYVGSNTKVDISNTAFYNNFIEYTGDKTDNVSYGGVMYINGSEVTITDSTISGNSAMRGGAIYAHTGSLVTLNGGLYDNNTATVHAGLIYNNEGTLIINASEKGVGEFKNHTANNRGGVILNNGTTTIYNGVFTDNKAEGTKGGGVIGGTGGAVLTIKDGMFQRNASIYTSNDSNTKKSADVHGGGVIESSGRVTIEGGTFQANTAMKGGVIYLDVTGKLKITGGTFGAGAEITDADAAKTLGNSASYRGGVICIEDEHTATESIKISNARFAYNNVTDNSAVSGGAMYLGSKTTVLIENCVFSNNQSINTKDYVSGKSGTYSYGGAIYSNDSEVEVKNTSVNNSSATQGGAIYASGNNSVLKLNNAEFSGNTAERHATDVFANGGTSGGLVYLYGMVKSQIGLNQKAKIVVEQKLTAGSQIVLKILNTVGNSGRLAIEFESEEVMNACKGYFSLHSGSNGTTISYANNKATVMK